MLIIYGKFNIGGIETFYLRLAKERFSRGLSTYFFLLSPKEESSAILIDELSNYANIFFANDIFQNKSFKFLNSFPLLSPLNYTLISSVFKDIKQIHIYDALAGLFAQRLLKYIGFNVTISVGFYHYLKYLWGDESLPMYEKINREFIFKYLPSHSLVFYSKDVKELHQYYYKNKFEGSHEFRIGVVKSNSINIRNTLVKNKSCLRIVSVGRLVSFKTYFSHMIDVVKIANDMGHRVIFDIYGDGPLKEELEIKICNLNLEKNVSLKKSFEYKDFSKVVADYDLFIGSGTSLIEASSLGLPCIVGIENNKESTTYGFFSDVYKREFNLNFLNIKKINISDLILKVLNMDNDEYKKNCLEHIESSKDFDIFSCVNNFEKISLSIAPDNFFKYNKFLYEFSRFLGLLIGKFTSKTHEGIFEDVENILKFKSK